LISFFAYPTKPIDPKLLSRFLEAVAEALRGNPDPGEGEFHRIAFACALGGLCTARATALECDRRPIAAVARALALCAESQITT
jgi:hypothetical protein